MQRQEGGHRPVQGAGSIHESQSSGGEPGPSLESQLSPGRGRSPAQLASGPTNEDIIAAGVQHPVVPFARIIVMPGYLDKALVQAEVVPDGVLPALLVFPVVGKVLHDELIDPIEGQALLRTLADGHHDEGVVGEGGLLILAVLLIALLASLPIFGPSGISFLLFGFVLVRVPNGQLSRSRVHLTRGEALRLDLQETFVQIVLLLHGSVVRLRVVEELVVVVVVMVVVVLRLRVVVILDRFRHQAVDAEG